MRIKSTTPEHWRFTTGVLLPVVLALLVTAAAVLGFVFWSTASVDARAFERQVTMVEQVLSAKRDEIRHDQESVAIWDDALINAKFAFDRQWVHINLGKWMYDFFGHDRVAVLDADNRPKYMMIDGGAADPSAFSDVAAATMPLVDQLRSTIADGGMKPYNDGETDVPVSIAEFVVIDNTPAIISVMPVVSDSRNLRQIDGSETVLVGIVLLDAAFSTRLRGEYLFQDASFSLLQSGLPNVASYPLLNSNWRIIGFFEWLPDSPGQTMLLHTAPALIVAFIIAGILVFLLIRQLWRSSKALDAGRIRAEHQAAHDKLTGLPNRMTFDGQLAQTLTQGHAAGAHVTLLMLDLDRFKQVNDTLGHQAGDELICAVGARLRQIVGDDMLIARLGGDEFAILSVARDAPLDTIGLSSRIIEAIGRPFELSHFSAFVGVSIGIVSTTGGIAEPRELIRKADIALYEAKASGRNRAAVYEERMNELLQLQHTIEAELRIALRRGDQLSVVFQPLVDQQSRMVVGAEALARWNHPKYGQISPARFVPVAESTGMIDILGEFVLQRACELGAQTPGRTIAVNISPTQLRSPRFAAQVFNILHCTGMRPSDLELEITESILLDDEHTSAQNLRTFRASGIHIALDDFGTGYSSLSYLKRYPVDRIKIDRSFVMQLTEGHVSVAITRAIVQLAHAMDIEVTAEGVETEEQATILGQMGCNTLQGFLFSPGVSPDRIAEIFEQAGNCAPQRRKARSN
ncbi:hypothetical protein VW29_05215 [Devosia limi DSM 17137]|uniref:Diguanylate cyclase (GGDEF) domain-containing protein n=1 Tax=Devosia limi DSM 17137 TaxID=1121477 RepID=A0A0F5LW50_9HYPH|nr:EAL domain-containing protein [Devosia limi]KKB85892.1 hypothetical protein VW29_05215 [Devosia limi DSM 17137]SHF68078.1 diguanylate cyclase (GGDEF) domain-containing protein [Devosia limi DSM 17137]